MAETIQEELFKILEEKGAKLWGVADLKGVAGLEKIADNNMNIGVSVAVPVPAKIVRDLKTAPTKEYYDMYYSLNEKLNKIVEAGAEFLVGKGYNAYANTTDKVTIDDEWKTKLPHKTVATKAGLGWIGKSCLLVTKEYGSAIRLSSFITDAPLIPSEPIEESRCGACRKCVDNCPAQALSGVLWKAGMKREEIFQREICKKTQTERMKQATGIETDLCGLCFAVCPYTERYLRRQEI